MDTNPIPLTMARPGQRVRVTRVEGGQGLRGRLCAMGLVPGTPVEVVCFGGGPVVLSVLGGRVMLGRGMAEKVMVREG
jgi:Fe2+ transport system protein FeoA